jgi:hypothetical protein
MLDAIASTDGTNVNWRMMKTVVEHVDSLDFLVDSHGAGEYYPGAAVALLHTLNMTNVQKLVIITKIFLCMKF